MCMPSAPQVIQAPPPPPPPPPAPIPPPPAPVQQAQTVAAPSAGVSTKAPKRPLKNPLSTDTVSTGLNIPV